MTLVLAMLAGAAWIGVVTVFVAACIGAGRADRPLLARRRRSLERPHVLDTRQALSR
jgi:hypothetical protein